MYIKDGKWKTADKELKERILEAVRQKDDSEKGIDKNGLLADTITVSFYPNFELVRVRDSSWKPQNLIWYFLVSDDEIVRLNGTSTPIHRINAEGALSISQENCLEYLKFFCFFVRGEEGPFLVVTSIDEEYLPKSIETELKKLMGKEIIEPEVSFDKVGGEYTIKTNVYYSNSLFKSEFSVAEAGTIEMDKDDEIVSDVPFEIDAPIC